MSSTPKPPKPSDDSESTIPKLLKPKNAKCGKCKNTVKQADKGLICEYCVQWFHRTCEQVSDDQYTAIYASGKQTHWFCQLCNSRAMETLLFIQTVKNQNEKMQTEIDNIRPQQKEMSTSFDARIVSTEI